MDEVWKDNLQAAQQSSRKRAASSQEAVMRKVSFFSYMPAFAVALLKDLLDLVLIGSLPGIGTIITVCFSLLIFFLLMLNGSGKKYSLTKKSLLLAGGAIVEGIFFGLNFLPIETMTVFLIYHGDKKASKHEAVVHA